MCDLVGIMSRGQAINSDLYLLALKTSQKHFRSVGHHSTIAEFPLQHNNARPHTSFKTKEDVTKHGWTFLPQPPYSSNLPRSDFHLFGALKAAIRRQRVRSSDDVIEEVRKWLQVHSSNLYKKRTDDSVSRWHKAVEVVACYV